MRGRTDKPPLMSKADAAVIVIYMAVFFFGGMFVLSLVWDLGLNPAFLGWLIYTVGVCALYRRSQDHPALKKLLAVIRTAALVMMAAAYLSPVICTHFERSSIMYPIKKYVFINGVNRNAGDILPEKLPKNVTRYYFLTQPIKFLAQDYDPYAYLVVRTDREFQKDYEAMISRNERYTRTVCDLDAERDARDKDKYTGEYEYFNGCPDKLPHHVYDRMYKDAYIYDDLDGSVIFCLSGSSTWNSYSGALINYDTGLLVVWR